MMDFKRLSKNEKDRVAPYLYTIQSLNESTDDYLYLWEVEADRMWFFGDVGAKYNIACEEKSYCMMEDWERIVYPKDLPNVKKDLKMIVEGKKIVHDMDYRVIDKEGKRVWVSCRGQLKLNEVDTSPILIGRISDTALRYKVDDLTGMFNVTKFREDTQPENWNFENGFLLLLGVDNLKAINISHGREYGDYLLKQLADVLENETDFRNTYRFERDCFGVFLADVDKEEVQIFYNRIKDKTSEYVELSGGAVSLSDISEKDSGKLYQYAEYALDRSKQIGKKELEFFSEEDYQKELADIELSQELIESTKKDCAGFSLVYQPQIKTGSYRLFGAEALLRYESPTRGPVMPTEFVPILEKSGLICTVGLWVLETALKQCKKWREKMPEFHISVNVSSVQLMQDDVMEKVLEILKESGLSGDALTLEITESMELENLCRYNEIFTSWKKAGIKIAVDDFGTGYSNLGYLKQLQIDEIKIDRCFVSGIQHNAYNYRLLSSVIDLVAGSDIRICCEGVEEKEELQVLEDLKPELLQGYLFSKPCDSTQFENMYFEKETKAYRDYKKLIGQVQKKHFGRMMKLKHYDILKAIDLGLWVIRLGTKEEDHAMYADDTMIRIMGADPNLSPEECYWFWYNRVKEDCRDYVNDTVARCISGDGTIQIQYIWIHPELGEVEVYCAATCTEKADGMVYLEGYHRNVSNIEMTSFV